MSGSHAPQASTDDRELLAAHLRGDAEAFGALVSRHRDRLWAVAVRTLGDRDEAADALQDALISAFRGAATYRGDAAVTTWLHRIVVNACLDRIRRRQARPTVPLGNHDIPTTLDAPGQVDVRLAVRAALAALPAEQREALVLVDLEDLPVAEAARLLGVPEGTIKSRCSRGRTALAQALRDDAGAADPAAAPIQGAPHAAPGGGPGGGPGAGSAAGYDPVVRPAPASPGASGEREALYGNPGRSANVGSADTRGGRRSRRDRDGADVQERGDRGW
ncbi:MAG: RNA polymerase sigma factor SigM [Kineosporiaceae bacterium]